MSDNTCKIYDTRPDICRVEKTYEKFQHFMGWDKYKRMNREFCREWQAKANFKGEIIKEDWE
jgi:Fe-S-cluster containining protein